MLATRFDEVFIIPVRRAVRAVDRSRNRTVDDLEFSDFGRSPPQSLGWVVLTLSCFWAIVGGAIVLA